MQTSERSNSLTRLRSSLLQTMLLLPLYRRGEKGQEVKQLFGRVCELLFDNGFDSEIWDESVLLQLAELFLYLPPNEKLYGQELERLRQRRTLVCQINDFFFSIISGAKTGKDVLDRLEQLIQVPHAAALELETGKPLLAVRHMNGPASVKINSFLESLANDLNVDFGERLEDIQAVRSWLQDREG